MGPIVKNFITTWIGRLTFIIPPIFSNQYRPLVSVSEHSVEERHGPDESGYDREELLRQAGELVDPVLK